MWPIIILGVAKNVANQTEILFDSLQSILDLAEGSQAFLYENDSTDKTPEKLKAMTLRDKRIHVLSETLGSDQPTTIALTAENKPCRMERIADARNKCMLMWEESSSGSTPSIVLWLDCDRMTRVDTTPIAFLAKQLMSAPPKTITAFFPMSLNHKGEMYDRFAYRDEIFALGPELMGDDWWQEGHTSNLLHHIHHTTSEYHTLPVLSAFNGMGLYRADAIRGLRFSAFPNQSMEKFYRQAYKNTSHPVHAQIVSAQSTAEKKYKGIALGRYLFGTEGLFWQNNSGYNQPVVCEWLPFHFDLRDRGWTGFYLVKGWLDQSGH